MPPIAITREPDQEVSPGWAWILTAIAIGVWFVLRGSLTRFPEWDEVVFYSQSGGYNGNGAPPSKLVASRESGPPIFLGIIRAFGLEITGTRIAVAVINTALLLVGSWRLEKHFGKWVGVVSALFFGLSWLFVVYGSSFVAAATASVLILLIFTSYLDFRVSNNAIRAGSILGLVAVVALWFRPFETLTVLAPIGLHTLLVKPSVTWKHRLPGVATAAAAVIVLFVIPWSLDSINRYGGVSTRFSSANSQGYTLQLGNRIFPYLDKLGGQQNQSSLYSVTPEWPETTSRIIVAAVLVGGLIGLIRTRNSGRHYGLLGMLPLTSLGFYLFVSAILTDRYLVHGLVFFAPCAAVLAVGAMKMRFQPLPAILVGVLSLTWFASQAAVAGPYQQAEEVNGTKLSTYAVALATELPGECVGVSRYGAPQWQFASGCRFFKSSALESAHAIVDSEQTDENISILIWPAGEDRTYSFGPDWQTVFFPTTGDRVLAIGIRGHELTAEQVARIESSVQPGP